MDPHVQVDIDILCIFYVIYEGVGEQHPHVGMLRRDRANKISDVYS